jgi:hypothetical protein
MARSIKVIYDEIVNEIQTFSSLANLQANIHSSQTFLADITTSSKVAIWRLWVWVISFAIYTHELVFDEHKREVEEIAASSRPGTVRWYQEEMFKFQYGYSLSYLNGKYQYITDDESAKIIKRCAVIETGGQVRIKVAKVVSSVVTPLSAPELSAAQAYLSLIQYAGVNTALISGPADLLKIIYKVYYDPLVLNANGSLISDPAIFPVEAAINNYISSLPFNSKLVLTYLTDAIQSAEGVVNPILVGADAKFGLLPYTPIVEEYIADAGHMQVDNAFPLSQTIQYIPNV